MIGSVGSRDIQEIEKSGSSRKKVGKCGSSIKK